jgi:GAF domain-containing protein
MNYQTLIRQSEELLRAEPWYVSALSNLSALIMSSLPDLNWAGFYLMKDGGLVVGPFQGNPACIHIPVGKGVCGTAVQRDETVLVPDVHQFPGHIACDSASQSEIVIPIHRNGNIVAVLDIDSPLKNRFTDEDRQGLEAVVKKIESLTVFRISRD